MGSGPGVEQADLGIQEADLVALALDACLNRLAGKQRVDDSDVFLHLGELHRAEPIARRAEKPVPTPKSMRRGRGRSRWRRRWR